MKIISITPFFGKVLSHTTAVATEFWDKDTSFLGNSKGMGKKCKKSCHLKCFILHLHTNKCKNMETVTKVSTSFRLNADFAESTTLAAIEEAKAQQQAYKDGKTQVEAIDLSSVENMLKSMGI
jgi:hypothetical protein